MQTKYPLSSPDNIQITEEKTYFILKKVIPKEFCDFLATYAQFKAQTRPNRKKNIDPLNNVHREYADPMMEMLLAQLTPLMERATGVALWPTLSFYYVYGTSTALSKHTDRSSCQWVASLCIAADPAFKKSAQGWPLILNVDGQPAEVTLDEGDILLFKGHETEHWRRPFSGQWFVSAIFAYVEQQGPFAFQKYDQRRALGLPHVGMFRWTFECFKQKWLR